MKKRLLLSFIAFLFFIFNSTDAIAQNCTVNAGINTTICPGSPFVLRGVASGSFQAGAAGAPKWEQTAGPSVNISATTFAANNATATVTGYTPGSSYTFLLSAQCEDGSYVSQSVTYTVSDLAGVTAGANATVCPGNYTMQATALKPGQFGYWLKISGDAAMPDPVNDFSPTSNLVIPTSASILSATYRWTVIDGDCIISSDVVISSLGAQPVSAGPDQVLSCYNTTTSTTLAGSFAPNHPATGQGGTWSFVSGPSTPIFGNVNSSSTGVSNLVQGTYVFRWTVTGSCYNGSDEMTVIVPPPTQDRTGAGGGTQLFCDGRTSTVLTAPQPQYSNETGHWELVSKPLGRPDPQFSNENSNVTTVSILSGVSGDEYVFRYVINNSEFPACSSTGVYTVRYGFNPQITINSANPQVLLCGAIKASVNYTTQNGAGLSFALISAPAGSGLETIMGLNQYVTAPASGDEIKGLTVAGTYVLRYRLSAGGAIGGCPDVYQDVTIVTSRTPSMSNAGTRQVLACNVVSTALAGNQPIFGTGSWTVVKMPTGAPAVNFSNVNAGNSNISNLVAGTYTFRWLINGGSGCTNTQSDVDVVVSTPTVTAAAAGSAKTVCTSTSIYLEGNTPLPGDVGVWSVSPSSGVVFSNVNDPHATVTGLSPNLVYAFTWKISNACAEDESTVLITTTADSGPQQANAGADQCLGVVNTISLTGIALNGGETGSWTKISGPNVTLVNGNNATVNPLVNGDNLPNGVYVFEYSISREGCTATKDRITITVGGAPTAVTAGIIQTSPICGNSVQLNGTLPTANIGIGEWTQIAGPAGWNISNVNANNATLTNLPEGTYTFRWTVRSGDGTVVNTACTPQSAEVSFSISPEPTTPDAGLDQTICNATPTNTTSTTLAANVITSGTGKWQIVSAPNTPVFSDINNPTATLSNLISGIYRLNWVSTGGIYCAPKTNEVVITVLESAYAGVDRSLCNTTTTLLTGNPNSVGTWSFVSSLPGLPTVVAPTVTTISNNSASVTGLNNSGTVTYTFRYTLTSPAAGTCQDAPGGNTDEVVITVYGAPSIAQAGPDQTQCLTSGTATVNLAAIAPTVGTPIWTIEEQPAGSNPQFSSTSIHNPEVSNLTPGIYLFKWTISNAGCTGVTANSDYVRIIINAPPTVATIVGGNQDNACGSNLILTGNTPTVGHGTWTYVSGPVGITPTINFPNSPTTSVTGAVQHATPYVFRWTIANPNTDGTNACNTPSSADVTIDVTATSAVNAVANVGGAVLDICHTGPATSRLLNANGTVGLWTIDPSSPIGASFTNATLPNTTINNLSVGTYTLIWTLGGGSSCESSSTVTFEVKPQPTVAVINTTPLTYCLYQPILLTANALAAGTTGTWSVSQNPNPGQTPVFSAVNSANSNVSGLGVGEYKFKFTTTNGSCSTEDEVTITILPLPVTAAAGIRQIACFGGTTTLQANNPDPSGLGHTGTWTIVSLPAGAPAYNIGDLLNNPNNHNAVFNASGRIAGTYTFMWTVTNGTCSTSSTTHVEVLTDITKFGIAPLAATVCSAGFVTITTDGDGIEGGTAPGIPANYTFQWQVSTNGGANYTNIPGATAATLTVNPGINQTGADIVYHYRRVITTAGCAIYKESVPSVITVRSEIVNNVLTHGGTLAHCYTWDPTGTITGTNPQGINQAFVYRWEILIPGGSWATAPGTSNGLNYNLDDLPTYTNNAQVVHTYRLRRVVESSLGICTPHTSNEISFTVNPRPSIANKTYNICYDATFTFAGVNPDFIPGSTTYTWTVSNNPNITDVAGLAISNQGVAQSGVSQRLRNTSNTTQQVIYTVTPTSGLNCDGLPFTITVNVQPEMSANTITLNSPNLVCHNSTPDVTGNVVTSGAGAVSYYWQYRTGGSGGWTNIGTANPASQNLSGLTLINTSNTNILYEVRRVAQTNVDGITCPTFSSAVSINVEPQIVNAITANQTVCSDGTVAALTGTPTGGNGTYTYAWFESINGAAYSAAPGINNQQTYTPPVTTNTSLGDIEKKYKRTVTSGTCATHESNEITIIILPNIKNNTISNAITQICHNTGLTLTGSIPNGGNGSFDYQWQRSTVADFSSGVTTVGGNTRDLATGNLTATTNITKYYFRRTVTSGQCTGTTASLSNIFEVTVIPTIKTNTFVSTPPTFCVNVTLPYTIDANTATGGIGAYTYRWERTITSGGLKNPTYTTLSGATSEDYALGSAAEDIFTENMNNSEVIYHYRRIVTSNPTNPTATAACNANTSADFNVTVNPKPRISNKEYTICSGTAIPFNVTGDVIPAGTTYSRAITSNPGNIGGATAGAGTPIQTLTNPTNTVQTLIYTVSTIGGVGSCPGDDFTVTVHVQPRPRIAAKTTTADCAGDVTLTPTNMAPDIVPAGTTYSWSAPTAAGITGITAGAQANNLDRFSQTNLVNTTASPINVIYTVTAHYSVTGPPALTCSSNPTFTVTVTVNPKPKIASKTYDICSNTAFTFAPSGSDLQPTGTIYNWTVQSAGGNITGATAGTGAAADIGQTLTNTGNTMQTVVYSVTTQSSVAHGSCAGSNFTITVNVYPRPAITTPQTTTICSGGTFTVTPANGGGNVVPANVTYTWVVKPTTGNLGNVTGSLNQSTPQSNINGSFTNPTNTSQDVILVVTANANATGVTPTLNCSSTTFEVTITVNPKPVISAIDKTYTICSNSAFTFAFNGTDIVPANTSYTWTVVAGANITGANANAVATTDISTINQTLVNTGNTIQTVTYTVTPISGAAGSCPGDPFNVVVTVNPTVKGFNTVVPAVDVTCVGTVSVNLQTIVNSNGNNLPATFSWVPRANANVSGLANGTHASTLTATLYNLSTTAQTVIYDVTPTGTTLGSCAGETFTVTITVPVCSSMSIVKTADKVDVTTIGETITYTIVVTNMGNANQTDVVVSDPLLGGALSSPVQSGSGDHLNTILERGEIWTYTGTYSVTAADFNNNGNPPPGSGIPADGSGKIINTASVVSTQITTPITDNAEVNLKPDAGFTITKTSTTTSITEAGQVVPYVISATNNGQGNIHGFVMRDPMLSANPLVRTGGDTNSNNIFDIGETWTYGGNYTVTQKDIDDNGNHLGDATKYVAGKLKNFATGNGFKPDGVTPVGPLTGTLEIDINAASSFSVVKASTTTAITAVNQVVPYTITVTNTGKTAISSVQVTDPMLGTITLNAYDAIPTIPTGDRPVANGLLDVGEVWIYSGSYTVTQADIDNNGNSPVLKPGVLTNTASVTGNKPDGTTVYTTPPTSTKDIDITAVSSYTVLKASTTTDITVAGQLVPYTVRVTNTGSTAITNVAMTDPMLTGVTRVFTTGNSDNILDVGEVWTYSGSYTVTQTDIDNNGNSPVLKPGVLTNTASVAGNKPDGTAVYTTPPTSTKDINITASNAFTVVKESTTTAITAAGQIVPYTITVTNTGAAAVRNIQVTDPMLGTVTLNAYDAVPAIPTGDRPVANGILDVGEVWIYSGSYTVTQADIDNNGNLPVAKPGKLTNTASVAGDRPDGTPHTPVTSTKDIDITAVTSYTVVKASTTTAITTAGQVVPYTVTVTNTGATAITNVVMTDPMLSNVTRAFTSGNNNNILEVGEVWTYSGSYTVTQTVMDDNGNSPVLKPGILTNTASVVGNKPDGDPTTPVTDTKDITLTQSPSYKVEKVAVGTIPNKPGDLINYSIVVTNTGNVTLSNIIVTDNNATVSGSPIISIAPGLTGTVTATHPLTIADITAREVINQAQVTVDLPDGTTTPPKDSDDPGTLTPDDPTIVKIVAPPYANDDSSTGNTPGNTVVINLLTNDQLGSTLQATAALTNVDLLPGTLGIQHTLVVPNEGTWTYDQTTGEVTFTPIPGFTIDPSPIPYLLIENLGGLTDNATITVTYTRIPPVADNDSSTGNTPGNPATVNVLTNDKLSDGSPATPTLVDVDLDPTTPGVQHTLVVPNEGTWTYNQTTGISTFTPIPGFTVDPTPITYTLIEKITGLTDNATITVTYNRVPPVADNDTSAGNVPGNPATVNVLTNDKLSDGSPATPALVDVDLDPTTPGTQHTRVVPNEGTWTYNPATGITTFTPIAGFTIDPTSITYTLIEKITGLTDDATITVTYNRVPPVADNDTSAGNIPGNPATVNVLTNDKLSDGSPVTPALVDVDLDPNTPGVQHTLVVPNEGIWVYNPATGVTTFTPITGFTVNPTPITYTLIEKITGLTDNATITITYGIIPPVADNDSSNGNTPGNSASLNLLTNDKLSDGSNATPTLVNVDLDPNTPGIQNTLMVANEGTWTYNPTTGISTFTPIPGFTVDPTPITYTLIEKITGLTDNATITVTYNRVPPVADNDTSAGNIPGNPATVNVLTNDKLSDGSPATLALVDIDLDPNTPGVQYALIVPNEGTWTYHPTTGIVTFTPLPGFTVDPTPITYSLIEVSTGLSDNAVITVTYNRMPPVASNDTGVSLIPGVPPVVNLLTNDKLADGSTANLTRITIDLDPSSPGVQHTLVVPNQGTWNYNPTNGEVTFIPNPGFILDPTPIPYVLTENSTGLSSTATITMMSTVNLSIGLAKSVVSVTRELNGSQTVTYLFTVKNHGNVPLVNVNVQDNLRAVFPNPIEISVRSVTATGSLRSSSNYNGITEINLLQPTSTLAVGRTEAITVVVNLMQNKTFGTFLNSATATATGDQVGGTTSDVSTNGTNTDPNNNNVPNDPGEDIKTPVELTGVDIKIPEGFSPNGDGINDKFIIENAGNAKIDLEIYNRWGNIVYKNPNYKNEWDGTVNTGIYLGQNVPDGTYYYIVKIDGVLKPVKFITVNR